LIRSFNDKTPKIATSAFVSEAAYVIGDVEIGDGSSVWPGAVVRGDFGPIKIGRNTQIEDNCVLHTGEGLIIGDNVHMGHGVIVHCRKVGNNVLLGNNATILDGCEIGNFCVIGAGSVVTPRTNIPDHSFVIGNPAQIVGKPSPEQMKWTTSGTDAYVTLAKEYKRQGL